MPDSSSPSKANSPAPAFRPGDWVEIEGMGGIGKIVDVDERRRRARVMVHDQEWVLPLKRLRPTQPPKLLPPINLVRVMSSKAVVHEIDLHGMRVEDAIEAVDQALDQAVVNQLTQLKIIHGHGTGAVRSAVRELLAHHHHVSRYRFGGPAEGGLACTIAEIRQARP